MSTTRITKIVAVRFPNSDKIYHYFCKAPIAVGDEVVANGCIVSVVNVYPYTSNGLASRWVAKIDNAEQKAEAAKAERRQEISHRLQEIERQIAAEERWKKLATKSPEAKRLLVELRKLI